MRAGHMSDSDYQELRRRELDEECRLAEEEGAKQQEYEEHLAAIDAYQTDKDIALAIQAELDEDETQTEDQKDNE